MTKTAERLQTALGSRFRITRELGGGGMSETFVAVDLTLEREIVIKVLSPALADSVNVERFSREIRLSATLQHPNLVPVLDSGVIDGLPYYTMPFVAGDSLRHRLDGTPFPVDAAIVILRDVARGLGAAHARGVVHRDIKPDNVLLSGNAAIVTDLGIAKALATSGSATSLTRTGIAMGTPAYFAPEQATGDDIDGRADWYAFGVMAFEMLTGRLPFASPTDAGMLVAHVTQVPPDIRSLRPALPEPLAVLVMQCLSKDPAARPMSADEVVRRLDASALADGDVSMRAAPATRSRPFADHDVIVQRRTRGRVFSLVVLLSAAVAVWQWRRGVAPATAGRTEGVRTVWLVDTPSPDTRERAALSNMEDSLRERIPLAAGVVVASTDTTLRDSSAIQTFVDSHGAIVVWLAFRAARNARGDVTARYPYATIVTPGGSNRCTLLSASRAAADASTTSDVAATDVVERVLGTLALRYDALLAARYLGGARALERENLCTGYRLDALLRLAAFRTDTARPMSQRLADLDTALRLDPDFIEAKMERAVATGDAATARALERGDAMTATNRLELEIDRLLQADPLRALQFAEQGAETGQTSLATLARAALNAAHPRQALAALDRMRPEDVEGAGGAALVGAMRVEAYYQIGDDTRALRETTAASTSDRALWATVRLPSLAALGDSVGWTNAMREASLAPFLRVKALLRGAAVAFVAGRRALSLHLYQVGRAEAEILLQRRDTSTTLTLLAAEARRRTGDRAGALDLLSRVRSTGNAEDEMRVQQLRTVIALETGDERNATLAVAAVERAASRSREALASLLLARIDAVRGDVPRATTRIQRALALGLAREESSPTDLAVDLRAEVDLERVFATASGKALKLSSQ